MRQPPRECEMQRKLTESEIEKLKQARAAISDTLFPTYDDHGQYWAEVLLSLGKNIMHGTSDGKPWVEPEPEIPEGYRKAEPDEWRRTDVKFWYQGQKVWVELLPILQGTAFDPPRLGTIYIVPIDPPLTDRDAAQWPRLLVMVRSDDLAPWEGPYAYLGKTESFYAVDSLGKTVFVLWAQARRATPAEIEAAK